MVFGFWVFKWVEHYYNAVCNLKIVPAPALSLSPLNPHYEYRYQPVKQPYTAAPEHISKAV